MKVNVREATGKVLDLLVAKSEGIALRMPVRAKTTDVELMEVPFDLFDVEVFCDDDDYPVSADVRKIKVIRYGIAKEVGATAPSITFIDSRGQKAWGSVDMFFLDKKEAELEALAAVKGTADDFHPSTNREQGHQIVEREMISTVYRAGEYWLAYTHENYKGNASDGIGPTPLVAAMRCYVASKLGEEIEVPDNLL